MTIEMAATGGVLYEDEGPYTTDVCHVEEMVGTTMEKRRMATESSGDETATRPGTRPAGPVTRPATRRRRRLVTNETAVTGGELEFDENEMAALEGQRLVEEFRCGIY